MGLANTLTLSVPTTSISMFCHRWARVSSEKPGLSLGDRKRLKLAITHLGEMPSEPATHRALAGPNAERRQLTVAFVDLVDFTALSRVLDPEDLRDAMRAYHLAVANVIREAQGFVAQFLGDGVLAFFGYPHATEDAAQRAVRASLRAVAAVKELPAANGHALLARAAVATGPVVVGKLIGDESAVSSTLWEKRPTSLHGYSRSARQVP